MNRRSFLQRIFGVFAFGAGAVTYAAASQSTTYVQGTVIQLDPVEYRFSCEPGPNRTYSHYREAQEAQTDHEAAMKALEECEKGILRLKAVRRQLGLS